MPVPSRTPVRTAAAMTMLTTATMDGAWATSWAPWSLTLGKFTSRAMAEPTMKTYGRGTRSATSMPMTATVRPRLNHCSLGRRVLRLGSRAVSGHRGVCRPRALRCVPGRATEEPPTAGPPVAGTGAEPLRPRTAAAEVPLPPAVRAAVERFSGEGFCEDGTPQISGAVARRRLRSCRPRTQAKTRTTARPAISDGIMGTKTSLTSIFRAVAARAVGPPQGTMFMVPLARPATQVRTTGLIFSRR